MSQDNLLNMLPVANNTNSFWQGVLCALPVMTTYLMIGMATGVVGVNYGLTITEIGLLCILLFAGSAQFAFPLLYLGSLPTLVLTVFYINIRHLIYSFSLSLQTRDIKTWLRCVIGAQLTDETFLIASARLRNRQIGAARWMIGINLSSYFAWFVGNLFGAFFAGEVNFSVLGVDFVAKAMFLTLLLQQITYTRRGAQALIIAIASGCCAVLAHLSGYKYLSIAIIVPIITALGVWLLGKLPEDEQFAYSLANSKQSDILSP